MLLDMFSFMSEGAHPTSQDPNLLYGQFAEPLEFYPSDMYFINISRKFHFEVRGVINKYAEF